jgi:phytoene synthase
MLDITWDTDLVTRAKIDHGIECPVDIPYERQRETLLTAYHYCKTITAIHSKSFYMASGLLPGEQRMAVRALYAFCRTSDDIIDMQGSRAEEDLEIWRLRGMLTTPRANDPVSIAWADARKKFNIPAKYAHQLLDGVARDISVKKYNNFAELAEYCYSVASTVGLMSMHIIGFQNDTAIRYAIKLGVALQLTNIIRDIAEDYEMGRVYLPQDELKRFGIKERHFSRGIVDDHWKSFMQFQIARARNIYEEAWPGISLLNPAGRLPIAAAATFYKGILNKIEDNNYDVFSRRAHLNKWEKLRLLPKLWLKYGTSPRISEAKIEEL